MCGVMRCSQLLISRSLSWQTMCAYIDISVRNLGIFTFFSFLFSGNGDLNTYEKLIIGTSAAGGGTLLFGFLLICCIAANVKDKR